MRNARIAAVLTWVYAAAFGFPAIPVAAHLLQSGRLPTFLDLFPMYGGPWSSRVEDRTFAVLLIAFLIVTLVSASAAWLVRNGSKAGAVLSLVMLPIEAVFWLGFALPFPWLIGIARAALLALAWKSLE
ncbi:MAG: hypothetical protein GEU68_03665 [Actinobacteria bacterium]|nr:hypothetical protein [Actinomycetota bacterium]